MCYKYQYNKSNPVFLWITISLMIDTIVMKDLYEYSTPELVHMLGERFKEYRMRCDLTQKEVSELSGVGLTTIHKFENGTAGNLSLSTFILLLKVIGQINYLDDLLPELPVSPYLIRRNEKKAQRIRHKILRK